MLKRLVVLALVMMMATATLAPMVGAQEEDLSGTTVTIFGAYTDPSEVEAFEAGFAAFEEETGIDVVYEGSGDFEALITARVEGGNAPDIAGFPQPGLMNRFADAAVDLSSFLENDYLVGQYGQSLVDMGTTADGKVIGVWGRVVVKSLVWYNPQEFELFGYTPPTTWDEMIALSDQIVADGGTPWYAPMESAGATGWVGTDWIEDIMLRITSLENYDRWATPASADDRLAFTSDEVRRAFELAGQVLLNEDYLLGGTTAVLNDSFFASGVPIIEREAFMVKQGTYMPPWIDSEEEYTIAPDGNLYYFSFPPIDEEYGTPVLIGGDIYTMFNDRPEVRAVMEYLTTSASQEPGIEAGVFIAPHQDTDMSLYPEAQRGFAEILLNASGVRFDGSDLMPGAVGAGTFWSGIVDWISGEDLGAVLESIDASWPTE